MRRLIAAAAVSCLLQLATGSAAAAPADLDPTFGAGGKAQIDFFGRFETAEALAVQPDGKIVIAGKTDVGDEDDIGVVRLNPDGSLDGSFGGGGKRVLDGNPGLFSNGSNDTAYGVAIQPDGKIVVAGSTKERPPCAAAICAEFAVVARLNSDGSNDGGFGEAEHPGRWVGGFGYSLARDVALQPDGKIVIAGDAYSFENLNDPNSTEYRDAWVLRLTAEGQFDLYGTQVDFGTQDRAEALLIQPDGKVVIAGLGWGSDNFDRNDMAFARLHGSNFALDDSFGTGNGKYTVGFGYVDFAFDIVQTSDGGFVAVGRAGDDVGVTKLNSSGTIDLPFAVGGASYEDFGGTDIGFGVDVQPDGKLVFGGGSTDDALTSGDLVAGRLNANGTPDAGFGVGGHSFVDFGALEFASDLVLQPDGRILLLGSTGNETNADFAVARLMGDYVPPPPEPGTPTVDAKTLRATPRGVVPIEITCEGDSNCVGAVVLETARRVAVSRRKRRLRLGSKRFSIPAGQTKVVRVKLRKKGFRLLKRKRKLRTRLTATSTDLSGVKTVTRKTLTLKAPKRAKKWRRR